MTRTGQILFAVLLLAPAGVVHAQDGLAKPPPPAQDAFSKEPVTCKEASEVIERIGAAMATVVSAKASKSHIAASAKPVSRIQVLDEIDRLSKEFASHYTLKPRSQYCDENAVKLPLGEKAKAVRLIKEGFVEPVASLAVGPADTLTMVQFAEALGFFIERWCDMTHMPSIKWSPVLEPDATPKPRGGSLVPVPSTGPPPRASK